MNSINIQLAAMIFSYSYFIKHIRKHAYPISVCFIIAVFIFSRLPFFIWMPIPNINPDTFDYYSIVQNMELGQFKGFGILPPGYILFLFFMENIASSTFQIILVQNLISFLLCIFMVSIIAKYYKNMVLIAAIALSIYMMDSSSIRYDNALLTEAFYRNSLLFVAGMFVLVLNSTKNKYWILFSAALIFPALIRSNGLYIYFLLFFLTFYIYSNKYKRKYYLLLFIPFIVLNITWSAFNYNLEGKFFPGNPNRIISNINNKVLPEKSLAKKQNISNYVCVKANLFIDFASYIAEPRDQYYFTSLPDVYRNFYVSDIIHDSTYKMIDWTIPIEKPLRKMVYKEFYSEPNKYQSVIADFNISTSQNYWLKTFHLYYKIHSFLFNNYLLLIAFFAVYIISAWQSLRSRLKNKNAFLLFCLGSIHFIAILSLTFFGWYHGRYIQVSEFIVYLTIALSPLLFTKIKEPKKPDA